MNDQSEELDGIAFLKVPPDKLVIRLRAKTRDQVTWLIGKKTLGPFACVAMIGATGQIVIRPSERMPAAWKKTATSISAKQADFDDERRAWFDIVRLQIASNLVSVSIEDGGRVSIHLSVVLAEARVGPGRGEEAVVITSGNVLEIWRRDTWNAWLLKSGLAADATEQTALNELKRRSE
jgi:DNA-binding transcriptional regulator/RsmH inhibitor MraZ